MCEKCRQSSHSDHSIITHNLFLSNVFDLTSSQKGKNTDYELGLLFDMKKNTEIIKRYIGEIKEMQNEFFVEIEKSFKNLNNQISEQEMKINDSVQNYNPRNLYTLLLKNGKSFDIAKYQEMIKKMLKSLKITKDPIKSTWIFEQQDMYKKKTQEIHLLENTMGRFRNAFQQNLKSFKSEMKKIFNFEFFIENNAKSHLKEAIIVENNEIENLENSKNAKSHLKEAIIVENNEIENLENSENIWCDSPQKSLMEKTSANNNIELKNKKFLIPPQNTIMDTENTIMDPINIDNKIDSENKNFVIPPQMMANNKIDPKKKNFKLSTQMMTNNDNIDPKNNKNFMPQLETNDNMDPTNKNISEIVTNYDNNDPKKKNFLLSLQMKPNIDPKNKNLVISTQMVTYDNNDAKIEDFGIPPQTVTIPDSSENIEVFEKDNVPKINENLLKIVKNSIISTSQGKIADFMLKAIQSLNSPKQSKRNLKRINIKRQSFTYEGILNEIYKGNKEAKCHFCKGSSFEKELYRKLGLLFGPFKVHDEVYYFHEMCALWSQGIEMNLENSITNSIEDEIERTKKIKCVKCGQFGAGVHCLDKNCPVVVHFRCLITMKNLKLNYNRLRFYCAHHLKKAKPESENIENKMKLEKLGSNSKKIKKTKGKSKE